MPGISRSSSYFLSITWAASCSECIPLLMWTYSQSRSGCRICLCGTAGTGTTSPDNFICDFGGFKRTVVHPFWALGSAAFGDQIGAWRHSCRTEVLGFQCTRLKAEFWCLCVCWSHAFLSETLHVYVLSELYWKVSVLCVFTRGCKSFLNSCTLNFLKNGYLPRFW